MPPGFVTLGQIATRFAVLDVACIGLRTAGLARVVDDLRAVWPETREAA